MSVLALRVIHASDLQQHIYLIVGRKMLKEQGKVSTCATLLSV